MKDWLSANEPSRFSRDFELEALHRMEVGENVSVLARELGVSRKSIYQWRDRYRLGGSSVCSIVPPCVSLTEAGERLLTDAQPVLDSIDKPSKP